jgi:hypothetical protein
MEFLEGIKTYIVGILIVIFAICYALHLIDGETFLKLLGVFIGLGAITMRRAIAKIEQGK